MLRRREGLTYHFTWHECFEYTPTTAFFRSVGFNVAVSHLKAVHAGSSTSYSNFNSFLQDRHDANIFVVRPTVYVSVYPCTCTLFQVFSKNSFIPRSNWSAASCVCVRDFKRNIHNNTSGCNLRLYRPDPYGIIFTWMVRVFFLSWISGVWLGPNFIIVYIVLIPSGSSNINNGFNVSLQVVILVKK